MNYLKQYQHKTIHDQERHTQLLNKLSEEIKFFDGNKDGLLNAIACMIEQIDYLHGDARREYLQNQETQALLLSARALNKRISVLLGGE